MSITQIKTYFRTHAKALGFTEHKDAFNWHNIGETKLNRAFHLTFGTTSGRNMLQPGAVESQTELTLRLFFQGFRDPATGVDTAISESEKVIKRCLKATNRLGGTLKNVSFSSMSIEPLDSTNDNSIISTLNFTASVLTDVEGA